MRIPSRLRPVVDFGRELAREFNKDNSSLMAAAVSFYVFLSLVPLLLFAAAALSYALGSQERAYTTVIDYVNRYSPALAQKGGPGIRTVVDSLAHGRGAATGLGILALLWAGSQVFLNLDTVVNIAWNSKPRGFIKRYLVAIGLLLAVGVLLLISFGITTAANAIKSFNLTILGRNVSAWFGWGWSLLAFLLPLVVTISTFTLLYKVMPNTKVRFIPALVGGASAGVLWELAKYGFSWYVTHIANYSTVYGSLAGIILLLVWIYYSSIVTILGAQISAIYQAKQTPH